jgi:hypothetical protein
MNSLHGGADADLPDDDGEEDEDDGGLLGVGSLLPDVLRDPGIAIIRV